MGSINQVQFKYVVAEDRIMLRVNSTSKQEFRFWLTRRYTKLLMPVLAKLIITDPQISQQVTPAARDTLIAFEQERLLNKANFAQPFAEADHVLPLGETPVLLSRIQTKFGGDGNPILCLHPENGQGIEMALNKTLMHAINRLLGEAVTQAGWELEPVIKPAAAEARPNITIN